MTIAARLATTAIAGLAGFAAVGIFAILTGPAETYLDLAVLMLLFTAVYVPGVFGARRLLQAYAIQSLESMPTRR
jgi:hypothetical protein